MMGITYFKAEPLEYARISSGGRIRKEGTGISGFIMPHRTNVELIGTATVKQPFTLHDLTSDKQTVTVNGGLVYRVSDPAKTLAAYREL